MLNKEVNKNDKVTDLYTSKTNRKEFWKHIKSWNSEAHIFLKRLIKKWTTVSLICVAGCGTERWSSIMTYLKCTRWNTNETGWKLLKVFIKWKTSRPAWRPPWIWTISLNQHHYLFHHLIFYHFHPNQNYLVENENKIKDILLYIIIY